MRYTLYDPTGNITALIEGERDAQAAAGLMQMYPEVEQTGFVSRSTSEEADAVLEMAGGEFCGNASMCAAAWYADNNGMSSGTVRLKVSGAQSPIEVRLLKTGQESFSADVHMPPAADISSISLSADGMEGNLPAVKGTGMVHLIIEEDSKFFPLLNEKARAEAAVKGWCRKIGAPGLGLMFVKATEAGCSLTPLVYVPGSNTLFWEHSCASGSSAVCMYIARKEGRNVSLKIAQPGGILKVNSGPEGTWLSGSVRVINK